jgi:hypothetical protein
MERRTPMTNLIAKPIVKNQLWVITDGTTKVGNIEANTQGYSVKIGGTTHTFSTTKSIEKNIHLVFEKPQKTKKSTELTYAHWPTDGKTHNNFYDVQRKLHVYTKTADSKCYYVAGHFNIKMNGEWEHQFCPKYIFVQRYEYQGPYNTTAECKQALNTVMKEASK